MSACRLSEEKGRNAFVMRKVWLWIGALLMIFGVVSILAWGVAQVQHMVGIGGVTVGVKGAIELLVGLIPLGTGYGIWKTARK